MLPPLVVPPEDDGSPELPELEGVVPGPGLALGLLLAPPPPGRIDDTVLPSELAVDDTVLPIELAVSFTCSTTRLITERFGVAFLDGAFFFAGAFFVAFFVATFVAFFVATFVAFFAAFLEAFFDDVFVAFLVDVFVAFLVDVFVAFLVDFFVAFFTAFFEAFFDDFLPPFFVLFFEDDFLDAAIGLLSLCNRYRGNFVAANSM